MTRETHQRSLELLIAQVEGSPKSAATLFTERLALWQSLGFSQPQVALWLASLALNDRPKESRAAYEVTPDIAEHLVSLLQQAGGRMPLAQALKKLPPGITTSEQHIRKLAQQHAQLEIKGPFLVLVN